MTENQEAVGRGRLSVVRTDTDGITVLSVHGEIDYQTVGALTRAMSSGDAGSVHRVVVDLSQVTFMDSSGVNALILSYQAATAGRGWLRLAGVRGAVLRTLQLVGIDSVIPCRPTVRDALVE
ncbi:STAS domain-containing protein [Streptomyces sp. NPDC005374]|uniref:STAS domain-containing protein n=1 Tax=Streptomyces sp. NPDC005374 TaxID=3364713 RepID=UPI0036952A99